MDLERLKAKRTTTRSLFIRLTTKINTGIETPIGENLNKEVKLGDLCELRCQLIEKINELKELDLQVEKVVNVSEIEKEVTDSEKYRETGIVFKSRLDRCISSLERTSNISQTNQSTEHAVGGSWNSRHGEQSIVCFEGYRRTVKKPSAKEELLIYAFGSNGKKESFDIVDLNLRNIRNPQLSVNIKAAVTDRITQGKVSVPSKFIKEIASEKELTLADDGCSSDIDLLIGSDFICEILGERNLKISKRLMVTNSIFGEILQGRINDEGKVNEIQVNYLSVMDGKMDYDKINEFWELENMGINSQENINLEMRILEKFEENTTYTNRRVETLPKAKEYYKDASQILKEVGTNLRKWVTSSPELELWWKNNKVDYRGCVAESEVTQKDVGACLESSPGLFES
ncbi:hypothetical protein AVEN_54054-1 [Araneus ventricosus]|uniref:Peptidase aspartic putative domain-containing protein n=1 Tax=Araneus ventricosus TaxID=182803 RepID=A0A4Y2U1N8_ARAVE|nr:hypothetical protein AVEN_54054-1 [Araneus ventricosus]